MIEVHIEQRIERPTDIVFAYVADFENNPKWQAGMQAATFTSHGPLAAGSTYDQVARFLGREIRTSFRVVAFEVGRRISIESTSGPFPIQVTRAVEPSGDGSLVTADVSGDATGFFRLWQPLMRWMVARSVRRDYRTLKQLLESQED